MITKFRAHGVDQYGPFTIEGDIEDYEKTAAWMREEPIDDVWYEYYDDEEGWIG